MAKRSLLLVDGDTRSLRVLEVSLKKAGFTVTTASNGEEAFAIVEASPPDLIISNTTLEGVSGFEFCRRLKEHETESFATIPFIFLTDQHSIEHKIRGLELGVDEYLTKPIYIKEILTRVRILLQKRDRVSLETRKGESTRFAGKLTDMGVVDLIQTIEVSAKSGVSHFTSLSGQSASLYFRDGRVIDAELGALQGADAIYRLLTWNDGEFEVLFRPVRRRDVIALSSQALLMEGMRRLDEWGRLLEQLPALQARFEVVYGELADRLGELPDELNEILKLFDGRRSLMDIIDQTPQGDLESLELIAKLFFEGLIVESTMESPEATRSSTDSPVIDLPPVKVRAAMASELEHDAGEDVLDIEPVEDANPDIPPLPPALGETSSTDESFESASTTEADLLPPVTSAPARRPSLIDAAIDAVAPIHPDLDQLPSLGGSDTETIAEHASSLERSSSIGGDEESSALEAASSGHQESVAPESPSRLDDSSPLPPSSLGDSPLGKVQTDQRGVQLLPELIERVRHVGERSSAPEPMSESEASAALFAPASEPRAERLAEGLGQTSTSSDSEATDSKRTERATDPMPFGIAADTSEQSPRPADVDAGSALFEDDREDRPTTPAPIGGADAAVSDLDAREDRPTLPMPVASARAAVGEDDLDDERDARPTTPAPIGGADATVSDDERDDEREDRPTMPMPFPTGGVGAAVVDDELDDGAREDRPTLPMPIGGADATVIDDETSDDRGGREERETNPMPFEVDDSKRERSTNPMPFASTRPAASAPERPKRDSDDRSTRPTKPVPVNRTPDAGVVHGAGNGVSQETVIELLRPSTSDVEKVADEVRAIASDVDAAMLELQSDFVRERSAARKARDDVGEPTAETENATFPTAAKTDDGPEPEPVLVELEATPPPTDEAPTPLRPRLEVVPDLDDDDDDDDYIDEEEEGVTPLSRPFPAPKGPPRLEVVEEHDQDSDDFPSFGDSTPVPELEPLPPAHRHRGPIESPHIKSSAGMEMASVAGAISSPPPLSARASSSELAQVVIESEELRPAEELREPDEPTVEEPLSGRTGRSSPPPIPIPPTGSPMPMIAGVLLTATLIAVLFLIRSRDSAPAASAPPDASSTIATRWLDAGGVISFDDDGGALESLDAGSPRSVDASRPPPVDATPTPPPAIDAAVDLEAERRREARKLLKEAEASFRAGDRIGALELVDDSIAKRSSSRAHAFKAQLLLRGNDRKGALESAERAIRMSSRTASAWLTKGRVHYQLAEFEQARIAFERYLQLRPTGSTADDVRLILERM